MNRLELTNAVIRVAASDFNVNDVKDIAAAADVITNIGAVAEIIQSMITTSPTFHGAWMRILSRCKSIWLKWLKKPTNESTTK